MTFPLPIVPPLAAATSSPLTVAYAGSVAAAVRVEGSYQSDDGGGGTTATRLDFSGLPLGADDAARTVVLAIHWYSAQPVNPSLASGVVSDGAITVHEQKTVYPAGVGQTQGVAIATCDPTGGSGDGSLTFSAGVSGGVVAAYRVLGLASAVPVDSEDGYALAASASADLDVEEDGVVFAAAFQQTAGSLTGVGASYGTFAFEASNNLLGGFTLTSADESPRSVSVSSAGAMQCIVTASFK